MSDCDKALTQAAMDAVKAMLAGDKNAAKPLQVIRSAQELETGAGCSFTIPKVGAALQEANKGSGRG